MLRESGVGNDANDDQHGGEVPIGKRKSAVFECIKQHGPITDEEMQEWLWLGTIFSSGELGARQRARPSPNPASAKPTGPHPVGLK